MYLSSNINKGWNVYLLYTYWLYDPTEPAAGAARQSWRASPWPDWVCPPGRSPPSLHDGTTFHLRKSLSCPNQKCKWALILSVSLSRGLLFKGKISSGRNKTQWASWPPWTTIMFVCRRQLMECYRATLLNSDNGWMFLNTLCHFYWQLRRT